MKQSSSAPTIVAVAIPVPRGTSGMTLPGKKLAAMKVVSITLNCVGVV